MRFMVCPQCGISNFYVKNTAGERVNVKVTREFKIVAKDESQSLADCDLSILFCLGCSWSGKPEQLIKYMI